MESFYLDDLVNAGMVINVNGRDLRFAELRVKDFARMQEHIRRIQPKPSDVVAAALAKSGASPEELTKAMVGAYEADLFWPASIDTRFGLCLIERDEGARHALIRFALEKHHPDLSESEANRIASEMSFRQWSVVALFVTTGKRPGSPDEGPESGQGERQRPQATTGTP